MNTKLTLAARALAGGVMAAAALLAGCSKKDDTAEKMQQMQQQMQQMQVQMQQQTQQQARQTRQLNVPEARALECYQGILSGFNASHGNDLSGCFYADAYILNTEWKKKFQKEMTEADVYAAVVAQVSNLQGLLRGAGVERFEVVNSVVNGDRATVVLRAYDKNGRQPQIPDWVEGEPMVKVNGVWRLDLTGLPPEAAASHQ